jgi:hypothetical protein
MAAIAAEARDAELLMLAAKINYMRAVESRCEQVAPGYSSKFQASYAKAKGTLLDRVGVDEALVDEAEKTPELAVAELVAKFDRAGAEKQKQYCEMNLQDLKVFTE